MSTQEEKDSLGADERKPTRRAKIMRGVVTPIFGLLAVACIVFGVLNATVWKPSDQVNAQAQVQSAYVVTDPGVLSLVDETVTVSAALEGPSGSSSTSADEQQICIAIASAQDATGWLAGQTYQRIKGLDSWTQLATAPEKVAGKSADPSQEVDFRHSDMWQQVKCGSSSVSVTAHTQQSGQVALISLAAAGEGKQGEHMKASEQKPDIKVNMRWSRRNLPNFAMPFYFVGALLAVLAVLSASIFAMDPSKRRKSQEQGQELPEQPEVTIAQAFGSVLPSFGRHKSGSERHLRHGASQESAAGAGPKIVDVHSKNMVADQQAAHGGDAQAASEEADGEEDGEGAGASSNPLQAYLKRLAHEVAGDSPKPADSAEPAATPAASAGKSADGQQAADADLSDETSHEDIDDRTVGALPAGDSGRSEDIDDETRMSSDDDISDETTQVFEARKSKGGLR
ncbi:hypothetical protein KIM372_15740 [Bombiscardovia nodaiensis]|uniref:GTPase regulator-like protein n=1 Tax=Bombiscardovia nodaiensis TaxID=2932181 RepID=A0ABM8B9T9_9BIFI|nr:hypothetical protein KIM372_15740 [Bombiscardovia nodaiensis]